MEIFRSDGGGNSLGERLIDLVSYVKNIDKSILESIDVINDHKGDLNIHLYPDQRGHVDHNYILSVFYIAWSKMGECNVTIHFYNGKGELTQATLS